MKTILVIYHSQGGTTECMARAVADGAAGMEGACAVLKRAVEASLDDLLSCDGLVIGSPEYFGYMAGAVKDFFDRTYEAGHTESRVFRKPYAVFIHAGNDGTGALASIERIGRGYTFKKIYEPLIVCGDLTDSVLARCEEMGQTIAAGCVAGIY
ncbi:MAG: NAD(P)H-dependent oxidoreductase [Deltaproteobacteria bacterium]|nr:NAD(P)H-dependent oxidoreductase [Deltaproteobacteria bacterium]